MATSLAAGDIALLSESNKKSSRSIRCNGEGDLQEAQRDDYHQEECKEDPLASESTGNQPDAQHEETLGGTGKGELKLTASFRDRGTVYCLRYCTPLNLWNLSQPF